MLEAFDSLIHLYLQLDDQQQREDLVSRSRHLLLYPESLDVPDLTKSFSNQVLSI